MKTSLKNILKTSKRGYDGDDSIEIYPIPLSFTVYINKESRDKLYKSDLNTEIKLVKYKRIKKGMDYIDLYKVKN